MRFISQERKNVIEELGMKMKKMSNEETRKLYFAAKNKIFQDLGFETKFNSKGLYIYVDNEKIPINKVWLIQSRKKERIAPVNESLRYHGNTGFLEKRNTFSDFVLSYINGKISYKNLLSKAKKMKLYLLEN